jgi:hypothetical protein
MIEFEQNLAPGTKNELYIGVAFIVLKSRKDLMKVLSLTHESVITRFFSWLRNKLCCCCDETG